jgi:hypothetical protein
MNKSQENNVVKQSGPEPDCSFSDPGISELVTSYLDGEVSGAEAEIARRRIRESPEIRMVAKDIQRAWDLLDFLPVTVSPETKTVETLAFVLQESGSGPVVLDDLADRETITSPHFKNSEISLLKNFRAGNQAKNPLRKNTIIAVFFGGILGFLSLVGLRFFEASQAEKIKQVIGVVENIQFLRDAHDIDFLKAIAVPELFGQPDSVVAQ